MFAADNPVISPIEPASIPSRNNDLTIEWFQVQDQLGEPLQRLGLAGGEFMIAGGHGLDILDAYQFVPDPAPPDHVPGGYVVRDTVHPRSERTSLVERREAPPEM